MNPSAHMDFPILAALVAKAQGDLLSAVELGKHFGTSARVDTILRSAVEAGSLSAPNWASSLAAYSSVLAAWVEQLRTVGVFDYCLSNGLRRIPPRQRVGIISSILTGSIHGAAPKKLSSLAVEAGDMDPRRAFVLVALSEALLQLSPQAAANLLNVELRAAVIAATDIEFLALITSGLPTGNSFGSTGTPLGDLAAASAIVSTHGASRLLWVVSPSMANVLAFYPSAPGSSDPAFPNMTPAGGTIQGVHVLPSTAVAADSSLLIDPTGLMGDSETITLDASRHGALQMDDDPATGEQNLTSLWQTNTVALRAERWFNARRARDNAVAVIESMTYEGSP